MKKLLVLTVVGMFIITSLQAQKNNCERWSIGANFTTTQPIGDMYNNGFQTNYGLTFHGLYNLNPESQGINVHLGGRITGGMTFGEKDRITLESPAGASARSSLYNTLADLVLMGRIVFQPEKKIQPYIDIYGGGRVTGTNQGLRLTRSVSGYDRKTSDRVAQYANWTWGTGVGVLIPFRENVSFDFGVNYMQSKYNRFVDFDSYTLKNDIIEYDIVNSVANSFGIHIGFQVTLDCNGYNDYEESRELNRRDRKRWKSTKRKPKMKQTPSQKN